jgi:diadenosine tetraphosphate (Ap4A) HIT family hydrolase
MILMPHAPNCPFCKALADPTAAWGQSLVWQFPNSFAVLGQWQYYTGYCMLIAREHAAELSQLGPRRSAFLDEMAQLAEAIECCVRPHKLNYELLGNQVPHLHWHLFPRSADDPNRLKPVWSDLERAKQDLMELNRLQTGSIPAAQLVGRLRETLKSLPGVLGQPGV